MSMDGTNNEYSLIMPIYLKQNHLTLFVIINTELEAKTTNERRRKKAVKAHLA